jgi:hypothetical protein
MMTTFVWSKHDGKHCGDVGGVPLSNFAQLICDRGDENSAEVKDDGRD